MNKFFLFSLTAILMSGLLMPTDMMGQDGDYTKFENENMQPYRVAYEFDYPPFPEKEEGTTNIVRDWNPSDTEEGPAKGEVEYKMEPDIYRLVNLHKAEMSEGGLIDGFRVQLFAGSNLGTANKIKSDFNIEYDEQEAYLDWDQPTFRVRVGNFLTRNEARIFCNELKSRFPGAFVVSEMVERPELRKPKFDEMIENPDSLMENRLPDNE